MMAKIVKGSKLLQNNFHAPVSFVCRIKKDVDTHISTSFTYTFLLLILSSLQNYLPVFQGQQNR